MSDFPHGRSQDPESLVSGEDQINLRELNGSLAQAEQKINSLVKEIYRANNEIFCKDRLYNRLVEENKIVIEEKNAYKDQLNQTQKRVWDLEHELKQKQSEQASNITGEDFNKHKIDELQRNTQRYFADIFISLYNSLILGSKRKIRY